jgi:methylenetetrahydrofolate reductase (NADPH)
MNAPIAQIVPEWVGIQQLLDGHSIEITAKDSAELGLASAIISPGTRVSITFLPKEDAEKRVSAASEIARLRLKPVPHISARRIESEAALVAYLESLSKVGACDEVFVVAGDPDKPDGPYEDALSIIKSGLLQHYGIRAVGIAGYPEGHPKIADDKLWAALEDKITAIKDQGMEASILTQFGFDAAPVFKWIGDVRARGIDTPIRLGVPGPASAAALIRFSARCGVSASSSVLKKYGLSLTRLMQPTGPDKYVRALASGLSRETHGLVGLHFYPFGGLVNTAAWIRAFSELNSGET